MIFCLVIWASIYPIKHLKCEHLLSISGWLATQPCFGRQRHFLAKAIPRLTSPPSANAAPPTIAIPIIPSVKKIKSYHIIINTIELYGFINRNLDEIIPLVIFLLMNFSNCNAWWFPGSIFRRALTYFKAWGYSYR